MFVILTYDVGAKRNSKVLKECRRYLTHVQKPVFEGFITDKQLLALKNKLKHYIDPESDQIAIYKQGKLKQVEKETIGYHIVNDNVI